MTFDEIFGIDADVPSAGHCSTSSCSGDIRTRFFLNPEAWAFHTKIEPETGVVYNRPGSRVRTSRGERRVDKRSSCNGYRSTYPTVAKDVRESDMPHADQWLVKTGRSRTDPEEKYFETGERNCLQSPQRI